MSLFEVWGGFECTLARVGTDVRDQGLETGHTGRLTDLDAAAEMGISRLRYPILWETVAPDTPDQRIWSRPDLHIGYLHQLGLPVIAGLVHHGSGPHYTSLIDPGFPDLLAGYARAVAERYPWISDFTPVNEPLTTARFSGLYGHWYPHARDEATFLRALVIQCEAIAASMAAIRGVTPSARLIQTEDLGRVFSTPALAYQAEYENERRWLSFDLLMGWVDRHHPWHQRMIDAGVPPRSLDWLADTPSPPDIMGINHYLTSDRYLDDDLGGYPLTHHGGNGRHLYADVAAVRAPVPETEIGFAARLREASRRYGLPLAMTEVHNGSTREEQLRWLIQAWDGAQSLRQEGIDLRAFTVWALAGGVDWPSLLTRREGRYEAGALDARADPPRPTAVASAARDLANTGSFDHPVIAGPGWWHRPHRFHRAMPGAAEPMPGRMRPLLLAGGSGRLAGTIARICEERGLAYRALSRSEMDIADKDQVRDAVRAFEPWAIINAAGYVRPMDAQHDEAQCLRDNCLGARVLADVAAGEGLPLVMFSSDLVFDGKHAFPYSESGSPHPLCRYGENKRRAEEAVLATAPKALVIRTSAVFSAWDTAGFAHGVITRLRGAKAVEPVESCVISPTYAPDLVHEVLNLLIDGADGIWHVANRGSMSWSGFASAIASAAGLDAALVRGREGDARNTTLRSEKGMVLPALEDAIERYGLALRN